MLVVSFFAQHRSHKQTKYHTKQAWLIWHWSISNVHGAQKPMHHTNYVFDNFISTTFSIEHCAQPVHDFCHIIYVPADTMCCMLIPIFACISIHSFLFLFSPFPLSHLTECEILGNKFCLQKFSILYTLDYCNIIIFDFYRERNGFAWYGELWTISDILLWIRYILKSNCTKFLYKWEDTNSMSTFVAGDNVWVARWK